ncbi:MAG TPA: hypothetical protein PLC42_06370 [Parachlamydiaceae bacterium]|nr:hypothetical protein [Parachlamydiaceae bacterium]
MNASFEAKAAELIIHLPSGESAILPINQDDRFLDVMEQANLLAHEADFGSTFFMDCQLSTKILMAEAVENDRDYQKKPTNKEKEDIAYILTTLGGDSLTTIWRKESSLKKAGNRIEHLHPLRFLLSIFSEEKTKVGLLQIKERGGKVSKEFFSKLHSNLSKEAGADNLKMEYIQDFAKQLKIDPNAISKSIEKHDWSEFVNTLIQLLPRSGDQGRYGI